MATRRVRIEWSPGAKVDGLLSGSASGPVGVLLAHGAGAGQRHPFMAGLRTRLADAGHPVLTFDYPYVEAGRRAPDRLPKLLECHRAAFNRLRDRVDRVVVAGKSMGGRVGGHLVAEDANLAAGLIFFGYPLVAIGSNEPRSTSHLEGVNAPMLFIQGERDSMGPPELIDAAVRRIPSGEMVVINDANHGFAVPKRTGLTSDDVLDRLASLAVSFVEGL